MFGEEKKLRGKKIERKKIKRKENREKSMFSFCIFGWKENKEKMKIKKMRVEVKWHIYPYK